ncbi:hypothetical protein [Flavobacterium sp. AG291]|uniref:hypothetical protein n=1 Tax=Flavobacterium sp. AG291 TaxID=2184000 RepID=UPI000E0C2F87|nr:hypothetical protein [Flavobacterium sp. AG291]RDI08567.1 hypothetical protein DEU42_110100 [Flavobacterium sp. AG291]
MKYLLCLLLFSGLCCAQNFQNSTKVTVCRLVNSDATGPCSIEYYAKKLKRTGHYIQAMESYNDTLAYNLLKLKADAKTWPTETCNCGQEPDVSQKPLVTSMFIVEVNSFKDTIFTTVNQKGIFFPDEKLQYVAPENNIRVAFTKDVDNFFKRDFAAEIEAWKMDFISVKDITYMKKNMYGLTRKEFEKNISYFNMVSTDSTYFNGKFMKVEKIYRIGDMEFYFEGKEQRLNKINIFNTPKKQYYSPTTVIVIDGMKIGDSEEMLCNKYDNSTLLRHWDAPLVAINNYYTYEIKLNNDEGVVRYAIRNGNIYEISIGFWYPAIKDKKDVAKKAG